MASDVLLQHLDYLLALAAERHFGRAAARCHVSQPTLSVAIRRLEKDLGIVIVQRGHRFEGFTEEGRRVVTWAQRIIAERDEMLADLERMRGRLTATARLGAIPTAVPASPFITTEFLHRNPAASVRIEALSSREIARQLADFEIDAGLTYLDDEAPPGTRAVELYREQYVLVAPADSSLMGEPEVAWSDAAALELCVLTTTMRNRRILDANMAAEGVQYRPVVEASSVDQRLDELARTVCPDDPRTVALRPHRPFATSDHRVHGVVAATRCADGFRRAAHGSARAPAGDRTRRAGSGTGVHRRGRPGRGRRGCGPRDPYRQRVGRRSPRVDDGPRVRCRCRRR